MPEDKSPEEPTFEEVPSLYEPELENQIDSDVSDGNVPIESPATNATPYESVPQVATQPVSSEQTDSTILPPQKSPKKKKLIIGAIIVGVIVLLTAGTAAAYNLWYQNPNKVVIEAIGSALNAGTSTNKLVFDVKTKDASAKISIDAKLAESPATEADVNATLSSGGKDYGIKGSTLTDKDGNLFFKINDVKALLTQIAGSDVDLSAFNSLITKVDGQWIKISADDLKSVNEDYSKTQTCTATALKTLDDKSVSNEVIDVYRKNQFLVVGDKIGVKNIDGVASLGYNVSIDGEKTKAFYVALGATKFGKSLTACDSSYTFKASDLDSLMDKGTTTGNVQIWSSRFGHQLKEVDVTAEDSGTTVTAVWNPTFVKGVTVTAPTSSVPLKDVITEVENTFTSNLESLSAGNASTNASFSE